MYSRKCFKLLPHIVIFTRIKLKVCFHLTNWFELKYSKKVLDDLIIIFQIKCEINSGGGGGGGSSSTGFREQHGWATA